jgi:hypothetical protein
MTTQIVDDFINTIRCHAADPVQVQRVDDLEAVLRALLSPTMTGQSSCPIKFAT